MPLDFDRYKGLSKDEVLRSRNKYGENILGFRPQSNLLTSVFNTAKDPMVIILTITSLLYFISGEHTDGFFMLAAIFLIGFISIYQENRSRRALMNLRHTIQTQCKVIRDSELKKVDSDRLVVGDILIVEEGTMVPADGNILQANDFSVNESHITGESLPVFKSQTSDEIYKGSSITSGLAVVEITATGNSTKLGMLGESLSTIHKAKTPLEKQIARFVKHMAIWGSVAFSLVWVIGYLQSRQLLESLLRALTMAMSVLPEEIPVAFTTFMAIGAYRLSKIGVVVKDMKTIETLGSANVICADKTGTLTQNKMALAKLYDISTDRTISPNTQLNPSEKELLYYAMWASEPIPFDPMEKELHSRYAQIADKDERKRYRLVYEYPLAGNPPIMTHIWEDDLGHKIIAAKGAPEAFLNISDLSRTIKRNYENAIINLGRKGFRVLAVGSTCYDGVIYPKDQREFNFKLLGLVAFFDPPKENIATVIKDFYRAGIKVKLVTGDNENTAIYIAKQVGIQDERHISGKVLSELSAEEMAKAVNEHNIFSRVFPEVKLKIIELLKSQGDIVAMTGDGINDAPALKASHIGIAMGKKGTDIAKEAANLVLVDGDLSKILDGVKMGRKIYLNLKKAIQYIISIHIPIILTVFLPLVCNWFSEALFYPTHIIILELIMGPTCSIIYENEPVEKDIMNKKPRQLTKTFFNRSELITSIIQGLFITLGVMLILRLGIYWGYDTKVIRSQVFLVLIVANATLTLVNRSFYYSIFKTLAFRNVLMPLILTITLVLTVALFSIRPLTQFLELSLLDFSQLIQSFFIGMLSVLWYEIVKWRKRIRNA